MQVSKIFSRLCWEMGYVVKERKEKLIPFTGEDPRELPYLKKLPFTLMELPLSKGIGLRFYPLSWDTYHPFILALLNNENAHDPQSYTYEILKEYSKLVNWKNANDFLGLPREAAIFSPESDPYEFTYPWSYLTPVQMKNNYKGYFSEENRRYDLKSEECLESVYVSDDKIQLEATRLLNLKNSIENQGYRFSETDTMGAAVFIRDGKWKWCVEGGQHRAAVVAALGIEKVPVYVKRIVRREDVNIWPGVQRKIYSSKSALNLFDRMFDLQAPSTAYAWKNFVDKKRSEKTELESFKK